MNRQSITSNEVGKGADAQVNSICGVFCLKDDGCLTILYHIKLKDTYAI